MSFYQHLMKQVAGGPCPPIADVVTDTSITSSQYNLTDYDGSGFLTYFEASRGWRGGTRPVMSASGSDIFFVEVEVIKEDQSPGDISIGILSEGNTNSQSASSFVGFGGTGIGYLSNGDYWAGGGSPTTVGAGATYTVGDHIGVLWDATPGGSTVDVTWFKNGVLQFTRTIVLGFANYNFALSPTNSSDGVNFAGGNFNVGQKSFAYSYSGLPAGVKYVSGCNI